MTQVIVVCEGQTEERFVKEVLARSLWVEDLYLYPRLIPTSPTSKGGSLSGQRVVGFLRDLLRQRWAAQIATFFDLYGLPSDFPGARDAEGIPDPLERATAVEAALRRAAVDAAGRGERRFHPHIQPYEFEALLFSETERFGQVQAKWADAGAKLAEARDRAISPEHINDGEGSHPSALLQGLKPRYRKPDHGVRVAARVGIERMRAECRHFDGWVSRLERLASGGGA